MPDDTTTAETDAYLLALGDNIRAFREQLGLTPDELGEAAGGIPKTTIWRLESGKLPSPKLLQLLPIAEALGYGLNDLLPGGSTGPKRAAEKVKQAMEALRDQAAADVATAREQTAVAVREAVEAERVKLREADAVARKKLDDSAKADREQLRQVRQANAKASRALQKALDDLTEAVD